MINEKQYKIIKFSIENYKKRKETDNDLKLFFLSKNSMIEIISESVKKSVDDIFVYADISEKFSKMLNLNEKIEFTARERVVIRSILLTAIKQLEQMQPIIPATAVMTPELKKSRDFSHFISNSVREISDIIEILRKEKVI